MEKTAYEAWQEELSKVQNEEFVAVSAPSLPSSGFVPVEVVKSLLTNKADMEKRILEAEMRMLEVSERRAQEKAQELFENLVKAEKEKAKDAEPKSYMYDPFQLMESLGYKERIMSMSYDTLRLMSERNPVVAAIINTRIHQVTSFSKPPKTKYDVGYEIALRDDDVSPSKADLKKMKEIGDMLEATGIPGIIEEEERDSFENFLSKLTRDSLTFDQACFEIVPGRGGQPVAFYAIDASTIRHATTPRVLQRVAGYSLDQQREVWKREMEAQQSQVQMERKPKPEDVRYVQVLNGRVINTYSEKEMAFGIRNPRTNIYQNSYGVSELELLTSVVTSHLWAEEHNKRFFSTGSAPKGIIHFEGQNVPQDQLTAFRRQWHAQVAGVWNAWRTPIISSPGKMVYTNLQLSNRQMEFSSWIEYLIKLICAIYLIDPAEINFDLRGSSGQQAPMFETPAEAKLKMSRDRGLKPMLRFLEAEINKNVIFQIDPRFELQFVGLNSRTEKEIADLRISELQKFKTVDEVRAEYDLEPIGEEKGGDLIMDSSYISYRTQLKMQAGMMGGGAPGQPGGEVGEGEPPPFGEEEEMAEETGRSTGAMRTEEFDQTMARMSEERGKGAPPKSSAGRMADFDRIMEDLKTARSR